MQQTNNNLPPTPHRRSLPMHSASFLLLYIQSFKIVHFEDFWRGVKNIEGLEVFYVELFPSFWIAMHVILHLKGTCVDLMYTFNRLTRIRFFCSWRVMSTSTGASAQQWLKVIESTHSQCKSGHWRPGCKLLLKTDSKKFCRHLRKSTENLPNVTVLRRATICTTALSQ